jgi:DNA-binding response OmpR family regulator
MRVLIVEDEHKVAQFLKKGFESEAFTVDIATDGVQGLNLALGDAYDVIVLDLMLPKMDGMKVLEELRREGVHTPVLILTARSEVEDRVQGLNLGADDYLLKPFSFSEVLARVRALLRRASSDVRGSILEFGDVRMDLLTRSVTRAGRSDIRRTSAYSTSPPSSSYNIGLLCNPDRLMGVIEV